MIPRDDGRYSAQYAADHCVCAYCWGVLVQRLDNEQGKWVAVCAENESHIGYHHAAFKTSEISRHTIAFMEVREYYRQTTYAQEFGLTPRLTGAALQDHAAKLKRVLGSDDSGIF